MKALVYNGPRDVAVSEVSEVADPRISQHFDTRDRGWTKVVLSPAA